LGFWWELHWKCRLLLVVQPFLLCWFYMIPMSMGNISIFCSLPRSLSSGVCSSPCRGHSYPLFSLLLDIWFGGAAIVYAIVSTYSFSVCSILVYRKGNYFCKLISHPATLL
jgi:hypothetical protein